MIKVQSLEELKARMAKTGKREVAFLQLLIAKVRDTSVILNFLVEVKVILAAPETSAVESKKS